MGMLGMFNFVTLNGFFAGPNGEFSWHTHGAEESTFSEESLKSGATLLFGRVTYDIMAGFWPTENAMKTLPVVAAGMNRAEKIVFSTTLKKADWNNTRVISSDIIDQVREMKKIPGMNMAVLGSGSIVTQFAEHGLFDQYQIMVDPVALGGGATMFKGLKKKLELTLTGTRVFTNGAVLLTYAPAGILQEGK